MITHFFLYYSKDYKPLFDLVFPNWAEYTHRHNYVLATELAHHKPEYHFCFDKVKAAIDYWDTAHTADELVLIDCDMIVTDMTRTIGEFTGAVSAPITIGRDINGLNCGIAVLKRGRIASLWLNTVWSLRGRINTEQTAMQFIEEAYEPYTKYVEGMNSIPYQYYGYGYREGEPSQWEPGHFTFHLPCMEMERRLAYLEDFKNNAVIR